MTMLQTDKANEKSSRGETPGGKDKLNKQACKKSLAHLSLSNSGRLCSTRMTNRKRQLSSKLKKYDSSAYFTRCSDKVWARSQVGEKSRKTRNFNGNEPRRRKTQTENAIAFPRISWARFHTRVSRRRVQFVLTINCKFLVFMVFSLFLVKLSFVPLL